MATHRGRNMTPEQKLDEERLERYLAREPLVPVLNDTKWKRLISCMTQIPGYPVRFRVKCLRNTELDISYWDGAFPWHVPRPFKSIEWIDFNPIVSENIGHLLEPKTQDFTEEICKTLLADSIPYEICESVIRVFGYKRPS